VKSTIGCAPSTKRLAELAEQLGGEERAVVIAADPKRPHSPQQRRVGKLRAAHVHAPAHQESGARRQRNRSNSITSRVLPTPDSPPMNTAPASPRPRRN
jgi:hypothetical protein